MIIKPWILMKRYRYIKDNLNLKALIGGIYNEHTLNIRSIWRRKNKAYS